MEYREKFAQRLVYLREQKGISQQELADNLNITRQSLSLYEKAERTINIELLAKIADFFNVSTDYLMGRTDIPSMNEDIQTACKVTGLSDEAIKNLKWIESNDKCNMMNMIISSQFFLDFVDFITIYFNDLINKYLKKMQIEDCRDEINKFSNTECEDRLKLCDLRNKMQKELEDLVEETYYGEFRLTKKFNDFLAHIDCTAEETAEKKERDSNANNNPPEE